MGTQIITSISTVLYVIPCMTRKIEDYQMTVEELPDCWKPIFKEVHQPMKPTCRLCEMRKHLGGAIR
jgi:hypothetical protein